MKTAQITIPGIPPSVNEFMRWPAIVQHNKALEWAKIVGWAVKASRVTGRFSKCRVTLVYCFPDNRRRDPDNFAGKFLLDGLRKAGVLEDDDFSHIELQISRGETDSKNPRVKILIEELEVKAG